MFEKNKANIKENAKAIFKQTYFEVHNNQIKFKQKQIHFFQEFTNMFLDLNQIEIQTSILLNILIKLQQQLISIVKQYLNMQTSPLSPKKIQPVIGTQIFDNSLPSELLDQTAPSVHDTIIPTTTKSKSQSISTSNSNAYSLDGLIQSYQIKGKCIFKQTPSYQNSQTISISLPTFTAKFPYEGGSGLKSIWESLKGYSKRQIYINEGFMYVLERRGSIGYYVHKIWPLDDIFKIFYDLETNQLRIVFTVGHLTESKDFIVEEKGPFFNRLRQELNKIGRQM